MAWRFVSIGRDYLRGIGVDMNIGDLVFDDYYGNGIVIDVDIRWCGATIFFFATQKLCYLDDEMRDSVEVVSESR